MMWAIFCLLAFYAFQTFFADQFEQDLIKLNDDFEDQMLGIVDTFSQAIGASADTAGTHTGSCSESSLDAMDKCYYLRMDEYNQCIVKADKEKNMKSAQNCCARAVVALKEDEKLIHALCKTCIVKCAQPKADCSKELKNLDPCESEKSKNLSTD